MAISLSLRLNHWSYWTISGRAGPILVAKFGPAGPIFDPDLNFHYNPIPSANHFLWFTDYRRHVASRGVN